MTVMPNNSPEPPPIDASGSAFAVDGLGGAAQLLSLASVSTTFCYVQIL